MLFMIVGMYDNTCYFLSTYNIAIINSGLV